MALDPFDALARKDLLKQASLHDARQTRKLAYPKSILVISSHELLLSNPQLTFFSCILKLFSPNFDHTVRQLQNCG